MIVEGICKFQVEFLYILLDLTRCSCDNAIISPLAGVEPAFPVQGSNQLSYRETVVEL